MSTDAAISGVVLTRARRLIARQVATKFVEAVNAVTFCARCGKQPIEWHHDDHPGKPNDRVSSLRTQGASLARIKAEMDKCEPVCRSCHMRLDGRAKALQESSPRQKGKTYVPPSPCSCCGRITTRTRNGKCATCDNHHSARRLRKTLSCLGCDSARPIRAQEATLTESNRT